MYQSKTKPLRRIVCSVISEILCFLGVVLDVLIFSRKKKNIKLIFSLRVLQKKRKKKSFPQDVRSFKDQSVCQLFDGKQFTHQEANSGQNLTQKPIDIDSRNASSHQKQWRHHINISFTKPKLLSLFVIMNFESMGNQTFGLYRCC